MRRGIALLFVVAACGAPAPQPALPSPGVVDDPVLFERGEDELLRDLATIDRRFAQRARIEPSEEDLHRVAMGGILQEDPTLAVNDGAIDPFSFNARSRGLDAAKAKLATLSRRGRPSDNEGSEGELLGRLVDAEVARLDEERALPRSASALVRAIVETWTAPKDEREAAEDDRWLARRLSELGTAMTAAAPDAALDVVRARDLDDTLDALEHLSTGMVKTTQELVRLRVGLESVASRPASKAHSDWDLVARRLRAQVGVTSTADELAVSFAQLENDLRTRAEPAIAAAGLGGDGLRDAIDKRLFVGGRCADAVPGSRVRSMAAPREREPACHLRRIVAKDEPAIALAVLHDHVVVAAWALDVARGAGTIAEAEGKHRLLVPVLPDVRARLERVALARPATAIGAGEAVHLLVAGDPAARAKAWSAIGDVPLDVAARELR